MWQQKIKEKFPVQNTMGIEPFYFSLDGGGRELVTQALINRNVNLMLEIGCFLCGSTIQWLDSKSDLQVVGIDLWEGNSASYLKKYEDNPLFDRYWGGTADKTGIIESVRHNGTFLSALANVRRFGDRFIPVKGRSPDILPELSDLGLRPQLIYFDSDKVLHDLEVCRELFPDAVLCGDDWTWAGPDGDFPARKAVESFIRRNNLNVRVNRATWLIE